LVSAAPSSSSVAQLSHQTAALTLDQAIAATMPPVAQSSHTTTTTITTTTTPTSTAASFMNPVPPSPEHNAAFHQEPASSLADVGTAASFLNPAPPPVEHTASFHASSACTIPGASFVDPTSLYQEAVPGSAASFLQPSLAPSSSASAPNHRRFSTGPYGLPPGGGAYSYGSHASSSYQHPY
jgi:hypothetical protein